MAKQRLIIGVSGASGAPITVEILKQLKEKHGEVETHLVMTRGSELTLESETDITPDELRAMASVWHPIDEIGVCIASGSFRTLGMLVVPCSMKTVAGIATGYSDNLLLRAADVCLKERRKLVLVARESPLSTLHLKNLYELSRLGAVIMPPMPAFYRRPESIDEMNRYLAQRILSQFDLDDDAYEWSGIGGGR